MSDPVALNVQAGKSTKLAFASRATLHGVGLAVLLLFVYIALEWLSFLHEQEGLPVTPWNPGLGLMFAVIIIFGPAYGIVLFIGVLLAELLVLRSTLPLPIILAIGAIVAASYTAVALVSRRFLHLDWHAFQMRDILVLFAGGLVGAVVTSTLLCMLLLSVNYSTLSNIFRTSIPLVLGDLIGIVVMTPLLLRAFLRWDTLRSLSLERIVEFAGFALAIFLLLALTIWLGHHQQNLFYLLFLPVVVSAVRHGIDGACTTLAIAQLVLVGMLHFHGFDLARFTEYQVLMLVLTLTGLVVGALGSERQLADEAARIAALKLLEMQTQATRTARLNLVSGMAAALAHEVNQPMTAARALARSVQQILRTPDGDIARAEGNVTTMIEQIDHAGAVVRRMREFLRRGKPHISTLDIKVVLMEALALVKPLAGARHIEVNLLLPDRLPPVYGDRVQVHQVIINLVRNAVEAITDSGRTDGCVSVAVLSSVANGEIEITVMDNGAGIDAEQIPMLFEPLNTSRTDGIGLGLSICKTLIEAHGGRIWLSSSMPGQTEFRFTLPAGSTGGPEP